MLENGEAYRACNRLHKVIQANAHILRAYIVSSHAALHVVKIVDFLSLIFQSPLLLLFAEIFRLGELIETREYSSFA